MLTPSLPSKLLFVALVSLGAVAHAAKGPLPKKVEALPAAKVDGVTLRSEPGLSSPQAESVNPYSGMTIHPVSTHDYNRLVFSEPAERIFVSDEKALADAPEYLSGNTSALLLFNKTTSKRPVQVIVNFKSGGSAVLYVRPGEVPGAVLQVENKEAQAKPALAVESPAERLASAGESAHAGAIRMLKGLATGRIPEGFQPLPLPAPTVFDRYTVFPEMAATDGFRSIFVFQLRAMPGKASVVSPSQFYRPGVAAVLVDGDRLDDTSPRRVFLVEDVNGR